MLDSLDQIEAQVLRSRGDSSMTRSPSQGARLVPMLRSATGVLERSWVT